MKILTVACLAALVFISNSLAADKLKCGLRSHKHTIISRIINGQNSVPHSWPWHVGLFFKIFNGYSFFCGGSLISNKYVLSAAHCFDPIPPILEIYIGIGIHNLTKVDPDKNLIKVVKIVKHENYNKTDFKNDIVLLELSKSIKMTKRVSTICLPLKKNFKKVYNKTLFVPGWGSVTEKVSMTSKSDVLNEIQVYIMNDVNQTLCSNMGDSRYCALNRQNQNSNLCVGDSGGSMVYNENGKWMIYGIVSFGSVDFEDDGKAIKCITESPTFFTIVPNYIDWINKHVIKKKTKEN